VVEALIIKAPLIAGAVIGLYEAILIHRDVTVPLHRFGHMLHALILAIVATFITFNVPFFLQLVPQLQGVPFLGSELGVRILVAVIMLIKIHGTSKVLQGSGMSSAGMAETWTHSLVIAGLIVAAPYAWPMVQQFLPSWAQDAAYQKA
jgi:hypothetical protein